MRDAHFHKLCASVGIILTTDEPAGQFLDNTDRSDQRGKSGYAQDDDGLCGPRKSTVACAAGGGKPLTTLADSRARAAPGTPPLKFKRDHKEKHVWQSGST